MKPFSFLGDRCSGLLSRGLQWLAVDRCSRLSSAQHVIVALCCLLPCSSAYCTPITYDFIDYPEYQNGCTLSGTVTTDGTLGAITNANIISWQFTITGPSISRSVDSSRGFSSGAPVQWFTTPTEFKLPPPSGLMSLQGFGGGDRYEHYGATIHWQLWAEGVPTSSQYYARTADEVAVETVFWNEDPFTAESRVSGWSIALASPSAVPEIDPTGMGSVLAVVAGALGLLERRRLKAA